MYRGSIYVIIPVDDKVVKEIPVDSKLNTAKLTPDGKYIFVSSRGPEQQRILFIKGADIRKSFCNRYSDI